MNREEIIRLFESGTAALNQAKSISDPAAYGDLIVEAKRFLDQVIDLTERDDPSFGNYVKVWASAHALFIAFVDYSVELDSYLASSPLVEKLNSWFHDGSGRATKEPYVKEEELEDFWAGAGQIQDECCSSLDIPALISPGGLAASIDAFGEAILHSGHNSMRIWNLCRSIALYLRMDLYNPSEISLCISSFTKATAPKGKREDSPFPPDGLDPFLSKTIERVLCNPQNEFRYNSLQSLAAFYAQRQLSVFNKLWSSYQSSATPADLDDAISTSFEGILWTQDTGILDSVRFELVLGHASAAYERFNISQRLEDLEGPVQLLQEVQSYLGIGDDEMVAAKQLQASMSADLAYVLSESHEIEDWAKSLIFWRQSVLMTESDTPDLARRLFELGKLAFKICKTSEDWKAEYFSEVCGAYERAATVATDAPFAAEIHFERASIFYHRFLETRVREDLDTSMKAGIKACNLVRQAPFPTLDDTHWSGIYMHCTKLIRSVQENIKGDDRLITEQLEEVVELSQLIIPYPHTNRLFAVSRLGLAYMLLARVQHRVDQSAAICRAYLEKALELHESALKETPAGSYLIYVRHTLVGSTYYQLYDLSNTDPSSSRYLSLSIDHFRLAYPPGGLNLNCAVRLAKALENRYKLFKQRSDLDECVNVLSPDQDKLQFGRSKVFLDAATQLVRICHEYDLHERAVDAYRRVFMALRKMIRLGLSSTERQEAIVYSVGYACDASATALRQGQIDVAVELLEEGRNLFFSQLLPIQMDTTSIRLQDPDLASYLDETIDKIKQYHRATDSAGYQSNQVDYESGFADDIDEVGRDYTTESVELLRYGSELERRLESIRRLPGHEHFMSLKPFSHLKQAARICPAVYLSISRFRCDALVIGSEKRGSDVLVVPLPTTLGKVLALSQTMRRAVFQQGRGVRDETSEAGTRAMVQKRTKGQTPVLEIQGVLHQLWDTIVRPVLLALDYLGSNITSPSDDLPHICWCPSGPSATFLPLHAAGDYARGPEHCAMTYVISTYTPTLSSLLHGLERESHTDAQDAHMLLISQSASPPNLPLPGVIVEKDRILATFEEIEGSGNVTSLHDEEGHVEEVIKQLPSHEMLHLACHGIQDMVNPLDSSVILHDGGLTIREIIQTPLPKAELVYLSACQTATGSINTPDESFSLAGSFMFAGYRGAVATMWSINDGDGCDVATSFYRHILQKDGSPVSNSALALHCAVQDLRAANPDINAIRWIPFVYFGIPGLSGGRAE
ncbi:unnamed protein product [Rhizoctonia solani]|uniref:CHAT domain-containing protein n=1 Tax=Rhizoctonia solani TaxID=456999 RepID=A0A8H2W6S3_9AGAM|nr:unnamed protein product [Rhizoctonia solani]